MTELSAKATYRERARHDRKRVKQSGKQSMGRYILRNGKAAYFCKTKKKRTELVNRLRVEGKLNEDYQLL